MLKNMWHKVMNYDDDVNMVKACLLRVLNKC